MVWAERKGFKLSELSLNETSNRTKILFVMDNEVLLTFHLAISAALSALQIHQLTELQH